MVVLVTKVPDPPNPTLRVRLDYTTSINKMGSRFFITVNAGGASGGVLNAIAADIAGAWTTHLAPEVTTNIALTEVDILDITTDMGNSGLWTGSAAGSRSGTEPNLQCPVNVQYTISRRYRGGKPRMYIPAFSTSDQLDASHWGSSALSGLQTAFGGFFTEVKAISESGTTVSNHISLSYYEGFHNIANSSGREYAAPTYRTTPVQDIVLGYNPKAEMGSQRRRRVSSVY